MQKNMYRSAHDALAEQAGSLPVFPQHTVESQGWIEWWYRLAAPLEPLHATAQDRERVRAGRLSSIILLIMFCFGLTQVPNALVSVNHFFLVILLTAMAINVGV